jgi:hypothetical protein
MYMVPAPCVSVSTKWRRCLVNCRKAALRGQAIFARTTAAGLQSSWNPPKSLDNNWYMYRDDE